MDFMQVAKRAFKWIDFSDPKKHEKTCHPVAKRFFLFILRLLDRLEEKASRFPQMHSL
jgi:hypothetical protein